MLRLKTKLSLFNLSSKLIFTALFLSLLPFIIERINLRQVDQELIEKRERIIDLISNIGIEPFITSDTADAFGSYNILKEEFISLEKINSNEVFNYIEVSPRLIEGEEISYRVLNYSFSVNEKMYLLEVGKSLDSIVQTGRNIRRILLLFVSSIIIITFFTDLQYTRYVLQPLDIIRSKLKLISDPSQFDRTPILTSTDDFARLDEALSSLMENINILFQKEKETTVNISHELLTPVSILRSKLENIFHTEEGNHELQGKIEESLKTLNRLQSLVNSLLMIAKIESNQFLLNEFVEISEILTEILNELKPIAEDKAVVIKNSIAENYSLGRANKVLIFSMFYNVINNAVKNTASGGFINLSGGFDSGKYKVTISDSGKGLTPEQKERLFMRFKMRKQDSGDGTGIGLAIAKSIADFHKIEVEVSSISGKGTDFIFIFPSIS
jgi:signal transduction histidine kinase